MILVRKSSLPRISSGKLHRIEIAERFRQGELAEFFRDEHEDTGETRPRPNLETPYKEPSLGTEQTVAEIWQAVLRIEKIGADDDFLALGGDSIRAAKIASKVGSAFGIEVDLRDVFNTHTVAEVAALIDYQMNNEEDDDMVEIQL